MARFTRLTAHLVPLDPPPVLRLDLTGAGVRDVGTPDAPPRWHRASAVLDFPGAGPSWAKPVCDARPFPVAALTETTGMDEVHGLVCAACFPL
jgi:hypothetical protein